MAYQDSITIVNTFVHYEPGDLVMASTPRSSLESGVVYRVCGFVPPIGDEYGVVFLEGEKYGYCSGYVRLATQEEIEEAQI